MKPSFRSEVDPQAQNTPTKSLRKQTSVRNLKRKLSSSSPPLTKEHIGSQVENKNLEKTGTVRVDAPEVKTRNSARLWVSSDWSPEYRKLRKTMREDFIKHY